jgi:hypothetical protein
VDSDEALSASVVIPSTLRRDTVTPVVEAAVAAVAGSPGGEVILVANGPGEGRRPLGIRSPRLRVVECPLPRMSAARNAGMTQASNHVVLLTDDDCLISAAWVERLTRLLGDGEVSVATPLKMRRDGPVTSFIDYQRIFHPRPVDAATVENPLTSSLGIRRDLIDLAFDDDLDSGDELQFGARLRDAGISTSYVAEAPPPIHLVPERLESVTERFYRYGAGNAKVWLTKGRPEFSMPSVTLLFSWLCRNQLTTPRRFEEIADPKLRQAFATLELCLLGSFLVGYLDEAGRILGREIIHLDQEGLAAAWVEIQRRLDEDFAWDGDWERLPVDFGPWLAPRETSPPLMAPVIAEILRRSATLADEPGRDPDLDEGGDHIGAGTEEVWARVNETWGEVREGRLHAEDDAIARRLRERGLAFRPALETMEAIALGVVQPEAEPRAQRRTRFPAWISRVTPRKSRTRDERSTTSR